MVRTNQGGSILGFVIIGGVMALLLIGGAYFVRHNLASVAEESPVAVDDSTTSDPSTEEDTVEEGENEATQPSEDENAGQEVSEPEPAPVDQPAPTEPDNQPTEPESSSPENLPATGPGDMLAASLLLGGVVGALAAYLRSRALPSSL